MSDTEKQKIIELWNKYYNPHCDDFYEGVKVGIEKMLEILDAKIKGINE